MSSQIWTTSEQLRLAHRLETLPHVVAFAERRGNISAQEAAMELATGLGDIGEAAQRISHELLPRLIAAGGNDREAFEALHDIGEELRHITYHVGHTAYYAYLVNEGKEA